MNNIEVDRNISRAKKTWTVLVNIKLSGVLIKKEQLVYRTLNINHKLSLIRVHP